MKNLRYIWIPLIIAVVIFYLCCLISLDDVPETEFDFFIPFDKIAHFFMYFGLSGATALFYIYDKKGRINVSNMLLGAILIPIFYGGLIEIIQWKFFPPRSGDWFDFLADALGSLSTLPLIFYFKNYLLRKQYV